MQFGAPGRGPLKGKALLAVLSWVRSILISRLSHGRGFAWALSACVLAGAPVACESTPELPGYFPADDLGGDPGTGGRAPGDDFALGGASGGKPTVSPCETQQCAEGERCEESDGKAECVANTCDDLACAAPREACEAAAGGAVCRDLSCEQDSTCRSGEYCKAKLCALQLCSPGSTSCKGQILERCSDRGDRWEEALTCPSDDEAALGCTEFAGDGHAGCTCRDDWDCPAFTECSPDAGARAVDAEGTPLGVCLGTGAPPTCTLPPLPFHAETPALEIQWGSAELGKGNGQVKYPTAADPDTPFPSHVQVVMTPTVANLDDDNQDGAIDENDIPEIIFLAFNDSDYQNDGVLRAVHGGGPARGKDMFTACGTKGSAYLEGTFIRGDETCSDAEADLDPTAGIAVGDLDYDGIPEIVAIGEGEPETVHVFSNTGLLLASSTGIGLSGADVTGENPQPTLANLDGTGLAEIIVGDAVFGLKLGTNGLAFDTAFYGTGAEGTNAQGPISCTGDFDGDGTQEIIAGPNVYHMPLPGVATSQMGCSGTDYCDNRLTPVATALSLDNSAIPDGFCAVSDILGSDRSSPPGPDNPLDGRLEVVLVANNQVYIFDPVTGTTYWEHALRTSSPGTVGGGPPNVDDFDGDGFPEIGTAGRDSYEVLDLQLSTGASGSCPDWPSALNPDTPNANTNASRVAPTTKCDVDVDCGGAPFACNRLTHQCICAHNSWASGTEDNSSRVTGSSVFDFNGDGSAEVIYNDECKFRIYDGRTGRPLVQNWSESRTRIEYPVVADVDRDGNAEIVFATSTESGYCSERNTVLSDGRTAAETFNAGVEVWGDQTGRWMSARGIWNQHAYFWRGVTEAGAIPLVVPLGRQDLGDAFRSNPRHYGAAADLVVASVNYSSSGQACGTLGSTLDFVVQVQNLGDRSASADSVVGFWGRWGNSGLIGLLDQDGEPLVQALTRPLGAGETADLVVSGYDPKRNGRSGLPDEVMVTADALETTRECNDADAGTDNNSITVPIVPRAKSADLAVHFLALTCVGADLEVENLGKAMETNAELALFVGDPSAGGQLLDRVALPAPLDSGEKVTLSWGAGERPWPIPAGSSMEVYAIADVGHAVIECDETNNRASEGPLSCAVITK